MGISLWSLLLSSLLFTQSQALWNSHGSAKPADTAKSNHRGPYETFVEHFSASRTGTDTLLYAKLYDMYPKSNITVTQDYAFDLLQFARADPSIAIRELDNIHAIKQSHYRPADRRRDGDGSIGEQVIFAGYTVAWEDKEFTAILASWVNNYQQINQWHLIGEDSKSANALIQACSVWTTALREAVLVFEQSRWRADHDLWLSIQQASWDDVILDEQLKTSMQHDYRSFFKSEATYKKLGVPWKRGLIFLGPPGNGKTVSLKAIMKEIEVPTLYVKTFHTYGGDEAGIRMVFERARAEAPCALILEDLDSLITDENRSFFLNEVDGLEDNDGLLLIGTTNHFDRLDPALSSRPSRFDRKYEFPNPSRAERLQYAKYWQDKLLDNEELDFPDRLLTEVADETKKFSFAYMKEAFISTLMTLATEEGTKSSFSKILLIQIHHLRAQLGDEELRHAADQNRYPTERLIALEAFNGHEENLEAGRNQEQIVWAE